MDLVDQREHPRAPVGQAAAVGGRPLRFVSVSEWADDASLKAWKASPGFREKIESVKALYDEFLGGDYDVTASVSAPALRS